MQRILTYGLVSALSLASTQSYANETALRIKHCFSTSDTAVTVQTLDKKAFSMPIDSAYRAPTTSSQLQTLDVLSIGMSMDVFRQEQSWTALQAQNTTHPEALHVGSILPMDPKKIPDNC